MIFPTYNDGYIGKNLPVIQEYSNLSVLDKPHNDITHIIYRSIKGICQLQTLKPQTLKPNEIYVLF